MTEQEARAEAERRYPGRYGSQSLFVKGAEWQASRKVEVTDDMVHQELMEYLGGGEHE